MSEVHTDRADRTNGFRVRACLDADRVAVQSTHQTTFFLTGKKWGGLLHKWHTIGLTKAEIVVLRPYGAAPVLEIESLGGPFGVLIVEATQSGTRTLRNGHRLRFELKKDEAVVIKTEDWREPRLDPGAQLGRL